LDQQTSGSITVANEATDTTTFPIFSTDATGAIAPKTNANFTFNSNTGLLSSTSLAATGVISSGANSGTGGQLTCSVQPVEALPYESMLPQEREQYSNFRLLMDPTQIFCRQTEVE